MQNPCVSPTAFVTGATGLLGNNLVRLLLREGYRVRALVRSSEKARQQFAVELAESPASLEIVTGDLTQVASFQEALAGVDVLFHTAAYFRDSYHGGRHWAALQAANVAGTRALLTSARAAGVKRLVHASSIAVLRGEPGQWIDETRLREEAEADDYYRSKILADREVLNFLALHPDFWAVLVLPGWMHGPGDLGPTQAGQTLLDLAHGRLPGVPPGTVSVVDARDVAQAMVLANRLGRRGERYLAAGRHQTMAELLPAMAAALGVPAPSRQLPLWGLRCVAAANEVYARLTGKPVLLSWAMVKNMAAENERSRFNPAKSQGELGLSFRPLSETLADEVAWFRAQGLLPDPAPGGR